MLGTCFVEKSRWSTYTSHVIACSSVLAGSESLVQALTRLLIDITQCQNLCLSSCLEHVWNMFGTCLERVPNVSSDPINFSLRTHPTTFDHLLNVVTSHFSSYCTTSPPFHTVQRLLPYISLGGSELRRSDENPRTKLFHRFFHPNYAAHRFLCPIIPPPTESRLPNSEAMQSQHP
jgi:hypothetical protein